LCLAFAFGIMGCDTQPCSDSDGVQLNAGFYEVENMVSTSVALSSLKVYAADTTAGQLSGVLYSGAKGMSLPLSAVADTATFILKYDSVTFDTLSLFYTKELKLVSHECGFDFFFELTGADITRNKADSVWIRKATVEYGTLENIKLFY
jgi:hypothetical protein